jgi:hypothetical protein
MAARWEARVAAAARELYGRGLLGALLLLAAERRLPQSARHAGRRLARWALRAVVLIALTLAALAIASALVLVELLAALVRALA